jgi:hypothetical protein
MARYNAGKGRLRLRFLLRGRGGGLDRLRTAPSACIAPRIEGYLVESQKPPTGLGEIPVPPAGSNLVFEFSRVTSFATNKKTFRARTRKAFENFFESTFLDGALSSARRSLVLARVNRERADDLRIRLAKPDERFFSL